MHSALLIVETPSSVLGKAAWSGFLDEAKRTIALGEGVKTFADSSWLLPLDSGKGMILLAALLQSALNNQFHYQVMFFDQEPCFTSN